MPPEDIEAIANAVAEKMADSVSRLPEDVTNELKQWAGYRMRYAMTGSPTSLQTQIMITDDGGFTLVILDCTGRPVTAERWFHP